MEGISKERVKELIAIGLPISFEDLLSECKELVPWLPIADAPKDRRIILWYPKTKSKIVGMWDKEVGDWWIDNYGYSVLHDPTLWQELPENPKE